MIYKTLIDSRIIIAQLDNMEVALNRKSEKQKDSARRQEYQREADKEKG